MEGKTNFLAKAKWLLIGLGIGVGLLLLEIFCGSVLGMVGAPQFHIAAIKKTYGLWAGLVLWMIFRDRTPKEMLLDIISVIGGASLGYNLGGYIVSLIRVLISTEMTRISGAYMSVLLSDILFYVFLGIAAAGFAFFAVKFRDSGKKVPYTAVIAFFAAIIVIELISWICMDVRFFTAPGKLDWNIAIGDGKYRRFQFTTQIIDVAALVICAVIAKKFSGKSA